MLFSLEDSGFDCEHYESLPVLVLFAGVSGMYMILMDSKPLLHLAEAQLSLQNTCKLKHLDFCPSGNVHAPDHGST